MFATKRRASSTAETELGETPGHDLGRQATGHGDPREKLLNQYLSFNEVCNEGGRPDEDHFDRRVIVPVCM